MQLMELYATSKTVAEKQRVGYEALIDLLELRRDKNAFLDFSASVLSNASDALECLSNEQSIWIAQSHEVNRRLLRDSEANAILLQKWIDHE